MENTNLKRKTWVFDIDGTLANHKPHRSPFDETRVGFDTPIEPVMTVLRCLLMAKQHVVFLSGRHEGCRKETARWLMHHIGTFPVISPAGQRPVMVAHIPELYMRADNDNRKDSIIKKEIYDNVILPEYDVIGVFDDRMQVCEMLYENNLFTFNVNQGLKHF